MFQCEDCIYPVNLYILPPGVASWSKMSGQSANFNDDDLFSDQVFSSSSKEGLNGGRSGSKKPGRTGRFKIIGDSRKSSTSSISERGKEMKNNPRVCVRMCTGVS